MSRTQISLVAAAASVGRALPPEKRGLASGLVNTAIIRPDSSVARRYRHLALRSVARVKVPARTSELYERLARADHLFDRDTCLDRASS